MAAGGDEPPAPPASVNPPMSAVRHCGRLSPDEEVSTIPTTKIETDVEPGTIVEVAGHRVGEAARTGEVLEVIGEPPRRHFRVRWEDGHVSSFFPSSDTVFRRPRRRSARRQAG